MESICLRRTATYIAVADPGMNGVGGGRKFVQDFPNTTQYHSIHWGMFPNTMQYPELSLGNVCKHYAIPNWEMFSNTRQYTELLSRTHPQKVFLTNFDDLHM